MMAKQHLINLTKCSMAAEAIPWDRYAKILHLVAAEA